MNNMPLHSTSSIAVAEMVLKSLDADAPVTDSAKATMPNLVAKMREFDRADLADRLDAYVTAWAVSA